MRTIALLPVRNEGWVLHHTLSCLSSFCDVVLVSDQNSSDDSREICRRFPKVELLESDEAVICEEARWQLLDAARGYDGANFLWMTDADELVPPELVRRFVRDSGDELVPGTAVEGRWHQLWISAERYRDDLTVYRPSPKAFGFVDDRKSDYDRTEAFPLHRDRVPAPLPRVVRSNLPVLHLQWLLERRNQMKQAWYRCQDLLHGGKTAGEINASYSITLPSRRVRTAPVPDAWREGLTFPDTSVDAEPTWQEREILAWFDEHGVERFEALEIWHIPSLRGEFTRRQRRRPRPDRSYRGPWSARARSFGGRALRAIRRVTRL